MYPLCIGRIFLPSVASLVISGIAASACADTGSVVIKSLEAGDRACYVGMENAKGKHIDALASFEICEQNDLIGKRVQLTWKRTPIMAMSCAGNPDCTKSETVSLIIKAKPVRAETPPPGSAMEDMLPSVQIGVADSPYDSFIANWKEEQFPVLYALIQTPEQFGQIYRPAPVMGNKRAPAPEPSLYEKSQILLVARVIPAAASGKKPFAVEQLIARNDELELRYRLNTDYKAASYSIKDGLALQIPKRHFSKVRFVENGKLVGSLDVARGQWSVNAPMMPSIPAPMPAPVPPLVGGDRDSHGCIGSAGYQWCAALNRCARSWEVVKDDGNNAGMTFKELCEKPAAKP